MKTTFFISVILLVLSCSPDTEIRFVRKEINNRDINIQWYYLSYISNVSPDFVVVEKKGKKEKIYEAMDVILNVTLEDSTIVLKVVEPSRKVNLTKRLNDRVFGYRIVLDSSGTYEELRMRAEGIKGRY